MRFTEYTILISSTPEKLVAEVNKLMRDRWQPCGGMVVTREIVSGIRQTFMQPMVREPNKRAGRLDRASEHVPQSLKHQTET
jgi:hypothetical protein